MRYFSFSLSYISSDIELTMVGICVDIKGNMGIKKKRVFVAVDLSEEALEELGKFVEKLASKRWPVKWEEVEKLHITLFFIGWVDPLKINSIKKTVEKGVSEVGRFSIKMGKLGVFPDCVQPRVVWLGIKGDQPALVKLQKQVGKELVKVGFEEEKRKWVSHLTIGRVKKDSSFKVRKELGRQLGKLEIGEFKEESLIERVVVYESRLRATGSEYQKLFEVLIE